MSACCSSGRTISEWPKIEAAVQQRLALETGRACSVPDISKCGASASHLQPRQCRRQKCGSKRDYYLSANRLTSYVHVDGPPSCQSLLHGAGSRTTFIIAKSDSSLTLSWWSRESHASIFWGRSYGRERRNSGTKPQNQRTAPEVETKKERTKKRNQFLEKASHD